MQFSGSAKVKTAPRQACHPRTQMFNDTRHWASDSKLRGQSGANVQTAHQTRHCEHPTAAGTQPFSRHLDEGHPKNPPHCGRRSLKNGQGGMALFRRAMPLFALPELAAARNNIHTL